MADNRLGIFVSCRGIQAIDIDCEADLTQFFIAKINTLFGKDLPMRSGKAGRVTMFLQVDCEHGLPKHVIKIRNRDSDAIEFLATRQGTMLAGAHKSGTRYEFVGGWPESIPTFSLAKLTEVLDQLGTEYGQAPQPYNPTGLTDRVLGSPLSSIDPFVDFLYEHTVVKNQDGSAIHIDCPWSDEHSTASTLTASTYFSPDTEHPMGAYVCLHGHCQHRNLAALHNKLGYSQDAVVVQDFADVVLRAAPQWPDPPYRMSEKSGLMINSRVNLKLALAHPPTCGYEFRYDTFFCDVMERKHPDGAWQPLREVTFTDVQYTLEDRGLRPSLNDVMVGIDYVADTNNYDSAQQWLAGLTAWDGVERVAKFSHQILKSEDSAYHTAVSRLVWAAQVGRLLVPGCKADIMPVLIGGQYAGKSQITKTIPPYIPKDLGTALHITMDMSQSNMEKTIEVRGSMVVEFDELKGYGTQAVNSIKSYLSRDVDKITPKFKSRRLMAPRRFIPWGTTNEQRFLTDDTGERRCLPIRVCTTGNAIDVLGFAEQRDQYWAEAMVLFKAEGQTLQLLYEAVLGLMKPHTQRATKRPALFHAVRESLTVAIEQGERVSTMSIFHAVQQYTGSFSTSSYFIERCLRILGLVEDDDTGIWDYENKEDLW